MRANRSMLTLTIVLMLYSVSAAADLPFYDPGTNQGVLDKVVAEFSTRAAAWQTAVMNAASWLFWTLGTISFTWTMAMLVLKKADIGDFFAEFIRFTLFFGFFYWLLQNGPNFADSIINSLRQIGRNASGISEISPSGIINVGFMIWKQAIHNLSFWSPIDSFIGIALSLGILIMLAVIAVNMLLLLVSAWILMYAGIFFLGFGGSRWTSDIAINYFKTVLGVAVQIFAMILLVGIGKDLLTSFYSRMSMNSLNAEELGVMLVFCVALLLLVSKIPPLLAGVISGGGSAAGIGNFTAGTLAGAVIGASGTAAAAASMAGAAIGAGAASIGGGAQALMAAFSKANASEHAGCGAGNLMAATGGENITSRSGHSPHASPMDSGFDENSGDNATGAHDTNTSGRDDGIGAKSRSAPDSAAAPGGSNAGQSAGNKEPSPHNSNTSGNASSGSASAGASRSSTSRAGAAAKVGRLAAGTAVNLAQGALDVATAKLAEMKDNALDRIGETTGGKIAAAIKTRDAASKTEAGKAPAFDDNSLSAGASEPGDAEAEVEAFRDRKPKAP